MEILATQAWLQQAVQVRLPGCSVACGTPEHLGQCGERGRGECGWWWWQSSAAFWLFTQGCTQWSRGCLYIWLIHKLSVCTAWIIHDFVWGEEWVFQHTTKGTLVSWTSDTEGEWCLPPPSFWSTLHHFLQRRHGACCQTAAQMRCGSDSDWRSPATSVHWSVSLWVWWVTALNFHVLTWEGTFDE